MKHLTSTTTAAAILAVASLCMSGCKTPALTATQTSGQPTATAAKDTDIVSSLTGDWAILDINGNQVKTPDASDYPYLGFQPNANNPSLIDFYAYNGCNFINGALQVKDGKVSKAGEFISTMKMCPDATYEMAITEALEQMQSFKIQKINNESFLYINNRAGSTIMTLRKHNLNFLEGAWRVTRLDGEAIAESVGMQMVIDFQTKTIHGNAGCNVMNGTIDIDMERENGIRFGNISTTRMTCPDIALEQSLLTTLSEVRSAVPAGNDKAKLLNAGNAPVIELKRMSKDELRNLE